MLAALFIAKQSDIFLGEIFSLIFFFLIASSSQVGEILRKFNLLFFKPGKTRGFHYHPHYIEYLLCDDGNGVLITRGDNNDSKTESVINLSKGVCTRAEKNSYHTVYSITEMTLVAMLTKQWDHSKPPIIKVDK